MHDITHLNPEYKLLSERNMLQCGKIELHFTKHTVFTPYNIELLHSPANGTKNQVEHAVTCNASRNKFAVDCPICSLMQQQVDANNHFVRTPTTIEFLRYDNDSNVINSHLGKMTGKFIRLCTKCKHRIHQNSGR